MNGLPIGFMSRVRVSTSFYPPKPRHLLKALTNALKPIKYARLLAQLGLERTLEAWQPADALWQQVRSLTREREAGKGTQPAQE